MAIEQFLFFLVIYVFHCFSEDISLIEKSSKTFSKVGMGVFLGFLQFFAVLLKIFAVFL